MVSMVLAAEPGDGFTGSRWVAKWGKSTLLGHVLDNVRSWDVDPGIVVLGADAEEVLDRVDLNGFSALIDPEWREGAASMRAGLDYLLRQPDIDAVVLVDGDSPQVTVDVVEQLIVAHLRSPKPATVPKYRYSRGRPLVVDRDMWPRLLGLEDSAGVEMVLSTHPDLVEEVWIDALPPRRVVTPTDLSELSPRR